MLNWEELLNPISADQPSGVDMSFSTEYDTIQEARRWEDPTIDQGEWVTDIKVADWPQVQKLCADLLKNHTKDLRLSAWWTEAVSHLHGFSGLAAGYRLVAGLCDQFWDNIHPEDADGDQEERIGNLSWLLSNSVEWMRTVPIVQGPLGRYSTSDYEVARASGSDGLEVLEKARRETPHEFYRKVLEVLPDTVTALQELETAIDARLGMDGPNFSTAREQLDNILRTVQRFSKEAGLLYDGGDDGYAPPAGIGVGGDEEFGDLQPQQGEGEAIRVASAFRGANAPISTRKEALAQLRQIAEFFRRTEPHSPVAYLAERAARWGEMPLHVWLKRVIKDDHMLSQMEELLDVSNDSDDSDSY